MISKLRPRITYANVISTLCLFMLLGGGAWAATSFIGSDGQIHGCVDKKGQLTVIKRGGHCKKGLSQIVWNQQGRPGIRGLQGIPGQAGGQGLKGDKGEPGQAGVAGSARAYALGGGFSCLPGTAPPFVVCPVLRGKGVDYIVKVATGVYCVGVNGISAAASDSVAVVTVSTPAQSNVTLTARWRQDNSACASSEFEVETENIGTIGARNTADNGSVTVAAPPTFDDRVGFTIAVL